MYFLKCYLTFIAILKMFNLNVNMKLNLNNVKCLKIN